MKKGVDMIGVTVCTFCHDGNGNYLFGKRSQNCRDEQGMWEPAGGGSMEFGERVEDTLRREIKEEICADVIEYEFLGFRDVHREVDGINTHWIALDFKVRVNKEQVAIGEPEFCDEIRWAPISDVPNPQHSQMGVCLERYQEKW